MTTELEVLTPAPLRDIKQVELYFKWGPLLPLWVQEITCPRPSDSILDRVKESTKAKNRVKAEKQRKVVDMLVVQQEVEDTVVSQDAVVQVADEVNLEAVI